MTTMTEFKQLLDTKREVDARIRNAILSAMLITIPAFRLEVEGAKKPIPFKELLVPTEHAPAIIAALDHDTFHRTLDSGKVMCLAVLYVLDGINDQAVDAFIFAVHRHISPFYTLGMYANSTNDGPLPDETRINIRKSWARHVRNELRAGLNNYLDTNY